VVLAAAAAAASPVVGLFLALVALAAVSELGRGAALRIGGPALLTAVAMAALFSEGGVQPYDLAAALAGLAMTLAAAASVGPEHRGVRRGAWLYAAAIALSYVVPSPMGSNVARLGVLFAGPLLLCTARDVRRPLVRATIAAIVVWQLWGPVTETLKATDNPATSAAYFAPLQAYLTAAGARGARVEVVPTATRWESVYVARHFNLARGWETQLDRRYDALFYHGTLAPDLYRRWLEHNGVRYVALPDAALERWGRAERDLIATRPAWLRPVWRDAHWQVFAVDGAASIISGPARLEALDSTGFSIAATGPGTSVVRVHYTPYWSAQGPGCVAEGPHGWTAVRARRAGRIVVRAAWSMRGLLGRSACATGAG
jgi:hypothetical protein